MNATTSRLHYRNRHCKREGYCLLTLLDGDAVAVATELPDNPGPSITNAAEAVGDAIRRQLQGRSFRLVEHYSTESYGQTWRPGTDRFSLVTLLPGRYGYRDAEWRCLPASELDSWFPGADPSPSRYLEAIISRETTMVAAHV